MFRTLFTAAFITIATHWAGLAHAQPIEPGQLGGACEAGSQYCAQSVCDQNLNLCVACGMPGEAACEDEEGRFSCHLPSSGYAPVPASNGQNMICGNSESEDCGQVGTLACVREGQPYCNYGALLGAYCVACGDFGQACCSNTVYDCDYGSCQGGTCLPDATAGVSQITTAIIDCRFKDAQNMIAALPVGNRATFQTSLDAAMAREDRVAALFEASRDISREARLSYLAEDFGNAALAYRDSIARLMRAKELTQCVSSLLVLDESLEMTERNLDQSQTEVALGTAARALDLCLFDLADESLAGIPSPNPQRDALMQRADEMRAVEARVLDMYQAAQALNATGKTQLGNSQFAPALTSFNSAHAAFAQVRQLTNCEATRNQIDEALAIVGRNILQADEGPPEVTPPAVVSPSAAHVCLDVSVPATHGVASYQRYLGGGTTASFMKGQTICGFDGSFSILSNDALVSYNCDREGDQYLNCRETKRSPITSWNVGPDGVTYHYSRDGNEYWIIVSVLE